MYIVSTPTRLIFAAKRAVSSRTVICHPAKTPGITRGLGTKSLEETLNPLPATFMRGGTSKGIFIDRKHLPVDRTHWPRIFLGIMGSPDPIYGRQLNGMGGGVSSLSKICVIGRPSDQLPRDPVRKTPIDVDVEYTFVQVGIRDSVLDYSGNCGNLSSMIGVFAVDEKMCTPRLETGIDLDTCDLRGLVRTWNTNTNKRIDNLFPLEVKPAPSHNEEGSFGEELLPALARDEGSVAGVPGRASKITLDFVDPGGARTGKLLPTGNPADLLELPQHLRPTHEVSSSLNWSRTAAPVLEVSLVDATNPTVFVTQSAVNAALQSITSHTGSDHSLKLDFDSEVLMFLLEWIRRAGAERMGLDPSAQAQPKIAVISPGTIADNTHITVRALSMGVPHKAVPMTVGLCLGVAARIPGTNANQLVLRLGEGKEGGDMVILGHPGGTVEVGAEFDKEGNVRSAKVVRTGRRLMKGVVWW